MRGRLAAFGLAFAALAGWSCAADHAWADDETGAITAEVAASYVEPPYAVGAEVDLAGAKAFELVNLDGTLAGWGFASEPLAPLPGFSGAPINMFVQMTVEGRFIDVDIMEHNEPIFVSGLGQAPFHAFVTQYKGRSINDTMVVGTPYGEGDDASSLVYLEGVTKATASVRIAHESVLAAAFAVAREKLAGAGPRFPVRPDLAHEEALGWAALVEEGIATRRLVTNAEVQGAFEGTVWADDDPEALDAPDEPFLDLWVVDVGSPAIAAAVLDEDTREELDRFREVSPNDEPILVIDAGRHGLVGPDFVRNTSPDLISATQDGLPIALRDADLSVWLADGVPDGTAMILRTDRRLGFDPTLPFDLSVRAVREHGMFQPEIGTADFTTTHRTPERFYIRDVPPTPDPPWLAAIKERRVDIAILAGFLAALVAALLLFEHRLAGMRHYVTARMGVLAFTTGFIGWWGQGQLSVATPLGVVRTAAEGRFDAGSYAFLLYDPFSLLLWIVVIGSFVLWGRGLFCGWLCPFGAMQEFMHRAARLLRLPRLRVPDRIDRVLVHAKYLVLLALVASALAAPALNDAMIEVEPFKTAVTTYFVRPWPFVAYAVGLLVLSMFVFKGFCRYVCPLGAVMAIGGALRARRWIERRVECGSPCQLCARRCDYNAIKPTGAIRYDECFACLDCVTIHDDPKQCVPLVLAGKGRRIRPSGAGQPVPRPASPGAEPVPVPGAPS